MRSVYRDGETRTITYDAANRPQTITLPQGTVETLVHDALGRETLRTTDTGEFRYLTYGVGDRIETMTDNTGTTDYEYDSAGRFRGIMYPHGGSVRYLRDKLQRTTDVTVRATANAPLRVGIRLTATSNGQKASICMCLPTVIRTSGETLLVCSRSWNCKLPRFRGCTLSRLRRPHLLRS